MAHFGLFTLNLGHFATYQNHKLKHIFCSRLLSCHLVAELLTGTDSLQKDQEMNMELPTMHETPELQVFRLYYGRPPTIQVKGYGAYPVGGVQGGRG